MDRFARRRTPFLLCLALAATLAASIPLTARAAAAGAEPPKGFTAPAQAMPMPTFDLTGIDGSKVRSADLRDKVTVIRFWATW